MLLHLASLHVCSETKPPLRSLPFITGIPLLLTISFTVFTPLQCLSVAEAFVMQREGVYAVLWCHNRDMCNETVKGANNVYLRTTMGHTMRRGGGEVSTEILRLVLCIERIESCWPEETSHKPLLV